MVEPSRRARRLTTALRALVALPEALHRALRGGRLVNDRGEVLDRDLRLLCRLEGLQRQDLTHRTEAEARRGFVDSTSIVEGEPAALAETMDATVQGPRGAVRVRWYLPAAPTTRALVYLHGGGWVVGDLRTHDAVCRWLAAEGRRIVVAVDYGLAPEAPFPAGLEDATEAFLALRVQLAARGVEAVEIGGDSAGGNLSAAVCLALKARGLPQPSRQLLVYPVTDLRKNTRSHELFGEGYLLTSTSIDWYLARYGADRLDARASVLLAPDLTGLAPAVVVTAGFDPLRDEGEAYAVRLAAAGVPTVDLRLGTQLHGFLSMRSLPGCREAAARVLHALDAVEG
jgi:acetyl esterase